MLVIVLSSIALASEDPVDEDSPRNLLLGYADYGFTAIFTLECTLKVFLVTSKTGPNLEFEAIQIYLKSYCYSPDILCTPLVLPNSHNPSQPVPLF